MKLRLFPINKLLLLLPIQMKSSYVAVVIVLLNAKSIDRENLAEVITQTKRKQPSSIQKDLCNFCDNSQSLKKL